MIDDVPTSKSLELTLRTLASKKRLTFGIEVVGASTRQEGTPRDPTGDPVPEHQVRHDLTNLGVQEALDRIVRTSIAGPAKTYQWELSSGVYHVYPAGYHESRNSALDRRVSQVEIKCDNVAAALYKIHELFDSTYANKRRPEPHPPERYRSIVYRSVSVSMANVTVRDVLDAIVRQNGEMSWVAEYADPTAGYNNLRLSFIGFEGWAVEALAQGR